MLPVPTVPIQAPISKLYRTYSTFVFQTTKGRDGETRENLQGQVSGAKLRVIVPIIFNPGRSMKENGKQGRRCSSEQPRM
jgi:hypothetical protein